MGVAGVPSGSSGSVDAAAGHAPTHRGTVGGGGCHRRLAPDPPDDPPEGDANAVPRRAPIILPDRLEPVEATIYERTSLAADAVVKGPAIIEQADTTTLITPGWTGRIDSHGNLIVTTNEVLR